MKDINATIPSNFLLVIMIAFAITSCAPLGDKPGWRTVNGVTPGAFDFSWAAAQTDEYPGRPIVSSDLVRLRDLGTYYLDGGLSVSPNGSQVLFQLRRANIEKNSYDLGWFVAPTVRGAAPVYVGDGGEVILYAELVNGLTPGAIEPGVAKWSPDGRWIAYRKQLGGSIQIWRVRTDGSGEEQLTGNDVEVVDFNWSEDGTKIYFNVMPISRAAHNNAVRREGESGYLFDDRFLPGVSAAPILKVDLTKYFRGEEAPVENFVYDLALRTVTPDLDADERGARVAQEALAQVLTEGAARDLRHVVRKGDRFTWLENTDPETYQGNSPPLTIGRRTSSSNADGLLCKAPTCTGMVTDIWLSDADDEVYFRRREGANFANVGLYAWQADGSVRQILNNDDWFSDCEMVRGALVCFYENWTAPRIITRINLSDGTIEPLVNPNPEFQKIKLGKVEKLELRREDGAEAVGHLVYPLDYVEGERYPLIIVQYRSRGFLRGGTGDEYPIHVLAANGFAVLSFDRPELWDLEAKEGDVYEREKHYWGEDLWERTSGLEAIESIIARLDKRGIIDPSKVGITGLSEGADSVWYAMMYSDRFAAAAVSSGGANSPSMYYNVPANVRREYYRAASLKAPGKGTGARWRRISAEFHADTITTPILIQGADTELLTAVPAHEALKDAGKPVEMYIFPDEYHVKVQPKHRLAIYDRNIDWFNFWLRGKEDPAPEKTEQYKRWQELRVRHCAVMSSKNENEPPVYCQ